MASDNLVDNLNAQVTDLRTSLKIHKEIVHNLLVDNGGSSHGQVIELIFNEMQRVKEMHQNLVEEKQSLEAKCLILEQINDEIKFKEQENEFILKQRIRELDEAIERKEFLFQLKEQKWAAIEKIMVDYAREDLKLQRMLADLRYICDDVSTRRNVRNVLQENNELKDVIEEQKNTIRLLSIRLQESLTASCSNDINNYTHSDSKKAASDESKRLPDLNCFNVKTMPNQAKIAKIDVDGHYTEQIKNLEAVIEDQNLEIRDLKSSLYDLNDTNNKIMKKMKEYKKKNTKSRFQTIELKNHLKELYKSKKEVGPAQLKEIIDEITEDCYSDEEVRSVSILTLSDAGSVYYPSKKTRSPVKKMRDVASKKMRLDYHRKTMGKIRESVDSEKRDIIKFDVEDVFLPAETMGPAQLSDMKSRKEDFNACYKKKIDFKKLEIFSENDDNENNEPNVRYKSPVRRGLNDSVVRISALRQSYQMSEIMAASSKNGESPIRASDIFSRRGIDDVLKSVDFK